MTPLPAPPPVDPFAPPSGRIPPRTPRDPNVLPDIQGPSDTIAQIQQMTGGQDPQAAQTVAQAIQDVLASLGEDARRRKFLG